MAAVRIAQMGQTAVNKPFFEVQVDGVSYAFVSGDDGRVYPKTGQFLKQLGVFSSVANRFQDDIPPYVATALKLAGDGSATRDNCFPFVTLGSGLAFVSDFRPDVGWINLFPANRFICK